MTLERIQALRDLDFAQLTNLAVQRKLVDTSVLRDWTPDRLRLALIDSIVEEELREQRVDEAEGEGRR